MKFSDLERIMSEKGVHTLAEIARKLDTTPQAVSNWKARDQIPYHIEAKFNSSVNQPIPNSPTIKIDTNSLSDKDSDKVSISDILLIFSQQLKTIILVPFTFAFITFTYVMFIQEPLYTCEAQILLPSSQNSASAGLAGLASQFGVSVPSASKTDLSSPSMIPDLLRSRKFAEKILKINFYSSVYEKNLPLIAILSDKDKDTKTLLNDLDVKNSAISTFSTMLEYEKSSTSPFSYIRITTKSPQFSNDVLSVVVEELEQFNKFYKIQSVGEKISFIDDRISSVKNELEKSEQELKIFREQNRQISSSPSLQLFEDRLTRNVEIQKDIFLTLKQQLELAKIEEVQEASIFQVLDEPQIPTGASNKNLIFNLIISILLGSALGIFLAISRSYINNSDVDERKKLRKVKLFFKKKLKEFFVDRRINGTIGSLLLCGLPFYLSHSSSNPAFFGRYSLSLLIFNILYVTVLIVCAWFFVASFQNKKEY